MQKKEVPLEIKPKKLRSNLLVLFKKLEKDREARDIFLRNPTSVISREVMKKRLPNQQLSEANRFLFALLANDKMVAWLRDYHGDLADKKQFAADFAREVQALDDKSINAALISHAVNGYGIPGLVDVAYQCVCNETPNKYECACTPVAKDTMAPDLKIRPELIRSLTDNLISRAKDLNLKGRLVDLRSQIG